MTEKEKAICADATGGTGSGGCSIDAVLALGVPGLEPTSIRYGYGVMPVGLVIVALGEAAYGLYKWFNS